MPYGIITAVELTTAEVQISSGAVINSSDVGSYPQRPSSTRWPRGAPLLQTADLSRGAWPPHGRALSGADRAR